MDFGCIDESGTKENKSEIAMPVVYANAHIDDTESNSSSKFSQCFQIYRAVVKTVMKFWLNILRISSLQQNIFRCRILRDSNHDSALPCVLSERICLSLPNPKKGIT